MESAKADRTWTEAEHRQAVRTIERKIISDTVKQRFINELESPYGDPIGFIEDLKDINRKSERLLPEEEQALENELLAELRERSALRSMRESQADAESEAISERTDRELTAELLGGTLTTRKLFDATAGGLLDPARALTLSNALDSQVDSPRKSIPETLATYERNLIRLNEDEIWNDPDLHGTTSRTWFRAFAICRPTGRDSRVRRKATTDWSGRSVSSRVLRCAACRRQSWRRWT